MWEESFKWLNEHYHAVFIFLIGAGITIVITRLYHRWTERVQRTEEKCHNIDNHIVPQLSSINSSLNTLSGSFNSLIVYLKSKDGKMDTSLFISKSPIQLTELGERILVTIGGKSFVNAHIEELIKEMDKQGIKTALDAQTFAPIVISRVSNHDFFNGIKNYAFKNPYYKEKKSDGTEISVPLDIGTITNVIGIYLRDKYLERKPHLNPEDVHEFTIPA